MKSKISIIITILVVIFLAWFAIKGNTTDYATVIDKEISALEDELQELETQVETGDMTPQEAAKAETRIVNRLESIQKTIDSSSKKTLSEEQEILFVDGLNRLAQLLNDFQSTLITVDAVVNELPTEEQPRWRNGGGSDNDTPTTISDIIEETIEVVEEYVEEASEEMQEEENMEEEVEEVVEEEETEEVEQTEDTTTEETEEENL